MKKKDWVHLKRKTETWYDDDDDDDDDDEDGDDGDDGDNVDAPKQLNLISLLEFGTAHK